MRSNDPDPLLTVAEITARLPCRRAGRQTKPQTVRTWMKPPADGGGLFGVQLRSESVAGTLFARMSWVEQFHREVAAARERWRRRLQDAAGERDGAALRAHEEAVARLKRANAI